MTRKHFVKKMMALGWSRNTANKLDYLRRNDRMDGFLAVRKAVMAEVLLRLGIVRRRRDEE
nr:MAG TPA: hypothetical protein [Caudoviricetes sp.]